MAICCWRRRRRACRSRDALVVHGAITSACPARAHRLTWRRARARARRSDRAPPKRAAIWSPPPRYASTRRGAGRSSTRERRRERGHVPRAAAWRGSAHTALVHERRMMSAAGRRKARRVRARRSGHHRATLQLGAVKRGVVDDPRTPSPQLRRPRPAAIGSEPSAARSERRPHALSGAWGSTRAMRAGRSLWRHSTVSAVARLQAATDAR